MTRDERKERCVRAAVTAFAVDAIAGRTTGEAMELVVDAVLAVVDAIHPDEYEQVGQGQPADDRSSLAPGDSTGWIFEDIYGPTPTEARRDGWEPVYRRVKRESAPQAEPDPWHTEGADR